jgi:hypothetical protein
VAWKLSVLSWRPLSLDQLKVLSLKQKNLLTMVFTEALQGKKGLSNFLSYAVEGTTKSADCKE